MSWDALHVFLDARDATHRAELDAVRSRYAALAGAVKGLADVVPAEPKARPTKCLMCNEPYGMYENKQLREMTARCGHEGHGVHCADDVHSDWVGERGPCKIQASAHDCYACRSAVALANMMDLQRPNMSRPAKCLMCDAPYGLTKDGGSGMTIEAKCGCRGVGSSCCWNRIGRTNWCDKPCRNNPGDTKCFACRQKK